IFAFDGYRLFRSRRERFVIDHFHLGLRVLGFLMAVAGGCGLCWMHFETGPLLPHEARGAGGILGDGAGSLAYVTFGGLGGTLVLLAMFLISMTLYSGLSWLWVMDRTGYWTLELYGFLRGLAAR